ncbi:MAG: hypothetical protein ACREU2_08210 [Steroidobacteraceae bacterium]
MIVTRRAWPRFRAARALVLPLGLLALAACSSNYNLGVVPSLGIGMNVALNVLSGTTQIQQGTYTVIQATVSDDVNDAGVTWSLLPGEPGTLTNATAHQVTYVAPPSGVIGAVSAQITATSVADSANADSVTMVVLGSPVLDNSARFPANLGVPYQTSLSVSGGVGPYAWTIVGTPPPGLMLSDAQTAIIAIGGTPTAVGTYSFEVGMTDATGQVAADLPVTLVVNPKAACLLSGQFTFQFSGYIGGPTTEVGNITIGSTGAISGEIDYKSGRRTTVDQALNSTNSICTNRGTNSGKLVIDTSAERLVYNFSATAPDANGLIHSARLQLINAGGASGSGQITLTDPTALTGTPPSGNFAFGLLGVDHTGAHYGTAGRFSADTGGNISAGLVDSNGGAASPLGAGVTDAAMIGALSAPDADGRGTITMQVGSATTTLAYYIVNANKLFVMNIDPTPSGARESGFVTTQTGDATPSTFDTAALASPSILSLWGAHGAIDPAGVVSLGRLSAADPAAGTIDLLLDSADQAVDNAGVDNPGQSYAVDSTGRGTLTLTGGGTTRSFVFYLDGTADGYIVEQNSPSGNAGLLEAQTVPPGGFPDTLPGDFVGGTQYVQTLGPVSLLPLMYLAYGTVSSNFYSGTFSIDPNTGRGLGTVQEQGLQETADVLYEVSPTKLDVMNFATPAGTSGTILWLVQ